MKITRRALQRLKSICGNIAKALNPVRFKDRISGLVQRWVRHPNVNRWYEASNNKELRKEKFKAIRELAPLVNKLNRKIKELDGQGIYVNGEIYQDHPVTGRAPIVCIDVFNRNS